MIVNYLKIAFRNIVRNKIFSLINILGMAIGMAACMLILMWVQDEMSFDKFHHERDKMYRVMSYGTKYMIEGHDGLPAALGYTAQKDIPNIEKLTFFENVSEMLVKYNDKGFYQNGGLWVDTAFFDFFQFQFVSGNPSTVLSDPYSIVLDEDLAAKLFDNENPIGKVIDVSDIKLKVSGVFKNIPDNSTLIFNYVIPVTLLRELGYSNSMMNWGRFMYATFIQLSEGSNIDSIAKQMTEIARENKCPQVLDGVSFKLQEFSKIHLDGDHGSWRPFYNVGDKKYVIAFSIIALFILLNACFNYINLSTARGERRSREVAMRKVSGADRKQLIIQFLGESFLFTIISILLAIILVELTRPYFNFLTQKSLIINYDDFTFLSGIIVILFFTGILAGSYPAFILSSFSPIKVLKNLHFSKKGGSIFRKILVIIQFTITCGLIIGSLVIFMQLKYMNNKKLGFDKDHIIYIPFKENISSNYYFIKNELLKDPNILSVSASDYLWATENNRCSGCFQWEGYTEEDQIDVLVPQVDFDFLKTFKVEIVEGRDFSSEFPTDSSTAYMVNESAVKAMGIEDPIGLPVSFGYRERQRGRIVGVFKDFHYESLHRKIESQLLRVFSDPDNIMSTAVMYIKFNGENMKRVLASIEEMWNQVNTITPFEYYFLDQTYDNLYGKDQRLGLIITYFTLLSILISCLGIFGLATFMAEKRTKEIGIRKVNGASVFSIVWLMTKDFVIWVIIAFVIAVPIAWYVMDKVLMNYEYRINLGIWIFLLAFIIVFLVAISTSVFQALRVAKKNPVDSLRYE
jgi:ABC-type antimicrobial peptide transport system permease subunit